MRRSELDRALALHRQGDLAGAAAAYRALIEETPDDAALWEYLAVASASRQDGATEAIQSFRKALILAPASASALFNLAAFHVRCTQDPLALIGFRRATAASAANAEVWMQRANTAIRLGRNAEALAAHRQATRLAPLDPHKWEQRATLLRRVAKHDEADRATRTGLILTPDAANLWAARSAVFFEIDQTGIALLCGRHAVISDPKNADGRANHAQALYRAGHYSEAVREAGEAFRHAPDNPVIAFNLGLYLLTGGNLAHGWRLYDARLVPTARLRHGLPPRVWVPGAPQSGRDLIVPAEQGLGDEVLFASCFADLAAELDAGHLDSVTVECTDRLRTLFERSFPDFRFFDRLRKPENRLSPADYSQITAASGADCFVMAGSLPGLFRKALENFPAGTGFLKPDPDRVAHWRMELEKFGPPPYLGLSWRSRAGRNLSTVYYPGPENMAAVLRLAGVRFVTLQYDHSEDEVAGMEKANAVEIMRPDGIDLTNDIDDTVALMAALDAVVVPNNLLMSLAGALGKPAEAMVHAANWTFLGTDQVPFWPSVHIHRRTDVEGLDWEPLMSRVATRLKTKLNL
ncbi:tetratricopeptide repeat protein [Nisaea sediminum]|uniref:tetratricopeptide repeat protein n=1 Tax=Nisaea sediminum TaxID=2775867 RepID=UPI001866531D|nr:tetratricopeptide repeat protein [Nisaea sediminum]